MSAPAIQHAALKKPRERVEGLERELAAATRAVEVSQIALRTATEEDKRAASVARVDGKAASKSKPKAEAVAGQHKAALERQSELEYDVRTATEKLDQVFEANRREIERGIREALGKCRAEYLDILGEGRRSELEMAKLEKNLADVQGKRPPVRTVSGGKHPDGKDKLAQPNGEPLPVDLLFDALEERGRAPEPKVIQQQAPLSRAVVGGGVFA